MVLPFHKKLLRRARGAVAQALAVAARQHQLHGAEEAQVEDGFLVGDELPNAIGRVHRTALQLHHHHGNAIHVQHDVGPTLVPARTAHIQGDFLRQRKVVLCRGFPVDQMHRLMRRPRSHLHRHAVAQALVGAQVGLVEQEARRVGRHHQLLHGLRDMSVGVAALLQVGVQVLGLNAAVALALAPVTQVGVAQATCRSGRGDARDHAVLRHAFGAQGGCHQRGSLGFNAFRRRWPAARLRRTVPIRSAPVAPPVRHAR